MKTCTKCEIKKCLDEFPNDKSRKDGKYPWCKECKSERNKEHYRSNKEGILEQHKEYGQTKNGKKARKKYNDSEKRKEVQKRHRENHPEKAKAIVAARKLSDKPCEACGIEPAEKHHPDYTKPLEVIYLCRKHHRELHEQLNQLKEENKNL